MRKPLCVHYNQFLNNPHFISTHEIFHLLLANEKGFMNVLSELLLSRKSVNENCCFIHSHIITLTCTSERTLNGNFSTKILLDTQQGWNWKFSHLNFNRFHCGWALRCWGRAMVSESWLNLVWGLLKFHSFKAHPWQWIDNFKKALTSKSSNSQKICVYRQQPKNIKKVNVQVCSLFMLCVWMVIFIIASS